jgi:type 2A phosphatase activator TIP41
MIFPDNVLRVTFAESNFSLEFNALDALKLISNAPEALHVAFAEEWKAAQEGGPLPGEIQYDWTFSTDYKGTLTSVNNLAGSNYRTEEKLNMEKLKQRENILFYEELSLYEDELHDNGTSNLSVKIRVMPSGFFILQRFFLRVDNVMAKISDTRVHYETGNKYILREFQERRQAADHLAHLPPQTFTDANLLYPHLTVVSEVTDKISIV